MAALAQSAAHTVQFSKEQLSLEFFWNDLLEAKARILRTDGKNLQGGIMQYIKTKINYHLLRSEIQPVTMTFLEEKNICIVFKNCTTYKAFFIITLNLWNRNITKKNNKMYDERVQ